MVVRKHVRKAFTLVEVLVVVAIMGLAAAVVVPQMLNPGTLHVQAAVRTVIADLMIAQNEAIVRQSPRRMVFETATSQYTLTDGAGEPLAATGRGGVHRVNFRNDSRFRNVRIENVSFGNDPENNSTIEFDEMGTPDVGGTVDVVSGTTRYRIAVAAFTGKVTVTTVASGG